MADAKGRAGQWRTQKRLGLDPYNKKHRAAFRGAALDDSPFERPDWPGLGGRLAEIERQEERLKAGIEEEGRAREHDAALAGKLAGLAARCCLDPESIGQAELDSLPRPHRRDFHFNVGALESICAESVFRLMAQSLWEGRIDAGRVRALAASYRPPPPVAMPPMPLPPVALPPRPLPEPEHLSAVEMTVKRLKSGHQMFEERQ